jgi:hypothetical protein
MIAPAVDVAHGHHHFVSLSVTWVSVYHDSTKIFSTHQKGKNSLRITSRHSCWEGGSQDDVFLSLIRTKGKLKNLSELAFLGLAPSLMICVVYHSIQIAKSRDHNISET